jgi:hypothetical protein
LLGEDAVDGGLVELVDSPLRGIATAPCLSQWSGAIELCGSLSAMVGTPRAEDGEQTGLDYVFVDESSWHRAGGGCSPRAVDPAGAGSPMPTEGGSCGRGVSIAGRCTPNTIRVPLNG